MSRHTWERNVVVPERREYWRTFPPLVWFPRCSRCGCLTDGGGLAAAAVATREPGDDTEVIGDSEIPF